VVAPARHIATRVLYRVVHDDAWAAPTLDAELHRASLDRPDAALATQIVYGATREGASRSTIGLAPRSSGERFSCCTWSEYRRTPW
jgi:hypothetical protein